MNRVLVTSSSSSSDDKLAKVDEQGKVQADRENHENEQHNKIKNNRGRDIRKLIFAFTFNKYIL